MAYSTSIFDSSATDLGFAPPPLLLEQLKAGEALVLPIGGTFAQELRAMRKEGRNVLPVVVLTLIKSPADDTSKPIQ